jgi:acyl-CoA dehydrogenase
VTIDFTLTEQAQALVDDVRDWSVTYGRPLAREADRIGGLPEGADKVAELSPLDSSPLSGHGYDANAAAELRAKYGDGPTVLAGALMEAVTYGDAWLQEIFRGNGIGAKVVRIMGNADQIEKWASQALMSGSIRYTGFALSEPQSGSDASRLRTTATRDGDSWVLNGSKIFNSGGATCDYTVVFATIDKALGPKGIRAFVVDRNTPGYEVIRANEHKMGLRSWQTSAIGFDNAHIPLNNCLGIGTEKEAGYRGALHSLASSRPVAGLMALGIGKAAVDTAQEVVEADVATQASRRKERVAEEFARLNAALQQARVLCLRACQLFDLGQEAKRESPVAKAFAPVVAERVALRSMQLMGPVGASEEYLVEKYYRDLKIFDIFEGTGNIQRSIIARQLAK